MNEWVVTDDAKVNAFVGVGDVLPDASLFDEGYSLVVGSGTHRVRLAVQTTKVVDPFEILDRVLMWAEARLAACHAVTHLRCGLPIRRLPRCVALDSSLRRSVSGVRMSGDLANGCRDASMMLVLDHTLTERYYVTEKALAMVPEGADRDAFLIELFEQHIGSVYCDDLFYDDASPRVSFDLLEVDSDA